MLARLFGRKPAAPRRIRIEPAGLDVEARGTQTILAAALEAGLPFPHSCRAGGCATCRCRLLEGTVKELTDKSYLLSAEEVAAGWILGCQSIPQTNVVLEVPGLVADDAVLPVVTTGASIQALNPLTHDILELVLKIDEPLHWIAGQYADLETDAVEGARSYSFATGPSLAAERELRFHVRKVPGGAFTTWLHESAKVGDRLRVSGPFGDFRLRPGTAPILAIAGGSGMAPLKALLEQARFDQVSRDVTFLYGARTQKDLYAVAEMEQLSRRWLTRLRFIPVLSEEPADSGWQGLRGLVTEHLGEAGDIPAHDVYMCGPPAMIEAAQHALHAVGVPPERIRCDKFLDRSHGVAASE